MSTTAAVALGETGAGAGADSVDDAAEAVVGAVVDGGVETDAVVVVVGAASFASPPSEQPVINRTMEISPIAAIAFITFTFTMKPQSLRLEYLLVPAPGHRRTLRGYYSGAGR
ncbi:hypothetical protein A4U64_26795 (plasmid) [Rhodococcus sp. WB1]|nr:hypothetical protein A4U64_26795 [Rhodococcus sp. WB1]